VLAKVISTIATQELTVGRPKVQQAGFEESPVSRIGGELNTIRPWRPRRLAAFSFMGHVADSSKYNVS